MSFLLRVELPDVPGSLGAVASALGRAGADIEAIEIVERRPDDVVVDDVLLVLPPTVMPDALITACQALDGVRVQWISRYTAGASLSRDLETVEEFTAEPARAIERLVELLPVTFRADWALAVEAGADGVAVRTKSSTAPNLVPEASGWLDVAAPQPLGPVDAWPDDVLAAAPAKDKAGRTFVVVIGRHGGPDLLPSEIARLGHMVSLAASVTT